MSAGAPEFLCPIIADFQCSGRQALAKLDTALAEGRFGDAKGILHQLKGSSGTIGLLELRELCAVCEAEVVSQTVPARRSELPALLDQSVAAALAYLHESPRA